MAQIRHAGKLNQFITRLPIISPEMYRALGIILSVLGLGLLGAGLYLAPKLAALGLALLGLGLPIAFLLWHRPEVGLLALIFLASSFIPASLVDLRLPIGGGLDLRDLVLIGLFGIVCLQQLSRGTLTIPWWPVGGPLLLFLIIAVFSAFYALVFEHVETNWALGDLRILSLYTTFYITLWSIKRPEQLKTLLIGLFIIADLTTLIIYLQQILGAGNLLLQAMMSTRDWRVYEQMGAVRVIPAGQVLMHFMWFVALGLLLLGRLNRGLSAFYVIQLLYISGGHLLSYTRAQWVALFIGLGLVFLILMPRLRHNLAKFILVVYCVAFLFAASVMMGGPILEASTTPFVAGISARFGSLLTPAETAGTGSLQWRTFEIENALQAIRKQPLTGVGLGTRYRELTTYQGEASGRLTRGSIAAGEVSRFTRYVHNSYISLAVKMGIPGLLAFLWFCAAALFKGFQVYRHMPDSEHKGIVLGILVAFVGLLVWSYFHAHLIHAESTGTIGIMMALVGSIAYIYKSGSVSHMTGKGIDTIP